MELTLIPAYGRDYKTFQQVQDAWLAGKDFRIETVISQWYGAYTSIRDLSQFPGNHIKVRFNQLTRFMLVDIKTGKITIDDPSLDKLEFD